MKNVFFVIILVLLISCSPVPEDECQILKGETAIDNCYFEKAIVTGNASICSKITMEPLKNACIAEIGIALNDLSLCNSLEETTKGRESVHSAASQGALQVR